MLFINDLREFKRKVLYVLFIMIYGTVLTYLFKNIILFLFKNIILLTVHKKVQVGSGSVINWPPRSGSVNQNYGSANTDPIELGRKEILTDPLHWF